MRLVAVKPSETDGDDKEEEAKSLDEGRQLGRTYTSVDTCLAVDTVGLSFISDC